MNGPDHYVMAELDLAASHFESAHVHALLALTAATVDASFDAPGEELWRAAGAIE